MLITEKWLSYSSLSSRRKTSGQKKCNKTTLSSENTSSSKPILSWCSREAQEKLMTDPYTALECSDAASAAVQLPTLPSCADPWPWGGQAATPRREKPWKHPTLLGANASLPVAHLGSKPPAIKYNFAVLRFCRKYDQDPSLRRPTVLSENIFNSYCRDRWSVKSGWV